MSHVTYDVQWRLAMQSLTEQVQLEYLPVQNTQGAATEMGFEHFAQLFINYVQIHRKLEDCHDRTVQPQKRAAIRSVLMGVIVRILEIRQQLIFFNYRPGYRFLALDDVLADLKLPPDAIDMNVPRFFLDDPTSRDEMEVKEGRISHWLKTLKCAVVPDSISSGCDPYAGTKMSVEEAIRVIERSERGRQGIQRARMVAEWRRDIQRKEERQKANQGEEDVAEQRNRAATCISAAWRAFAERRFMDRARSLEYEFLGMAFKTDRNIDYVNVDQRIRDKRKKMQEQSQKEHEKSLAEELLFVREKEGPDMKADMLDSRRCWILEYRRQQGVFPKELNTFYERFDPVEAAPPPEAAPEKGKGKDSKDKPAAAKKDAKGKKTAEEPPPPEHPVGPTAVVQEFVQCIKDYAEVWEGRDESNNFDQKHDPDITRNTVRPVVEKEVQEQVDALMVEELQNLRNMYEKEAKSKKKPKKAKKAKAKKSKEKKWCIAQGLIGNQEDLFPDLVDAGILKKIVPAHLSELQGELSYLAARKYQNEEYLPPPSIQAIKSLVVQHVILPLGNLSIRQRSPYGARSLLMYGPKGSGKSLLARAIATECGATFFDLSPATTNGQYTQPKTGAALLVHKTYLVARECAPSVIYMDDVHEIFAAGSKKKKSAADDTAPSRIKKELGNHLKQIAKAGPDCTSEDRILFIGCTTQPHAETVDTKEMLAFFEERIWLSFPEYTSRVFLWKHFCKEKGVTLDDSRFDVSTLAQISEGYPAGSIERAVSAVLTPRRVQKLSQRPLTCEEFVGPLSRTPYCWPEQWKGFRDFDHLANGEKDRQDKLRKAEAK